MTFSPNPRALLCDFLIRVSYRLHIEYWSAPRTLDLIGHKIQVAELLVPRLRPARDLYTVHYSGPFSGFMGLRFTQYMHPRGKQNGFLLLHIFTEGHQGLYIFINDRKYKPKQLFFHFQGFFNHADPETPQVYQSSEFFNSLSGMYLFCQGLQNTCHISLIASVQCMSMMSCGRL